MLTWNLGDLFEGVVDAVGDRVAIVAGDVRLTFDQLDQRASRLANLLTANGVGAGDHVALALRNGNEYLEGMLAAFKVRAVPINVNTRYTMDELRYLIDDAAPRVVIHEPDLTDRITSAIEDRSDRPWCLARGEAYEHALAESSPERPDVVRSGDDRYLLYTGGTTGLPKGVVWRHEDLLFAALGGGNPGGDPVEAPEEVVANARLGRTRCLPASPFTHGTAHWTALSTLLHGGTVIVDTAATFDAVRLWDLAEQERATILVIVGDAFARPLADALGDHPDRWMLDDLLVLLSGGAVLSPVVRDALLHHVPWIVVVDGYGTSETGGQGQMPTWAGQPSTSLPRFHVDENTTVLDDAGRPAPPGSGLVGRLARRGRIPLGYHGDPARSAETFVELHGQRWAIPGDLARVEADGSITLLGRGASSINSGGEKVFPEEVERVLKAHSDVFDAVVVGVPDDRFGERVAAVVAHRADRSVDLIGLEAHCRTHLADFKVPRRVVVVDAVVRRPSGKVDLEWAAVTVLAGHPPA
ncbi:AMP-binding protein [Aquihabitans sp. McL0605]|uniref:AMP-binding protein n=1 Tax=Aquihabitans sp. McL0605 TaxID=3415671 RepID=UPI003CF94B7D